MRVLTDVRGFLFQITVAIVTVTDTQCENIKASFNEFVLFLIHVNSIYHVIQ